MCRIGSSQILTFHILFRLDRIKLRLHNINAVRHSSPAAALGDQIHLRQLSESRDSFFIGDAEVLRQLLACVDKIDFIPLVDPSVQLG